MPRMLPPHRYIEIAPSLILRVMEALARKTGWAFSAYLGGPHPGKGGAIETMSYAFFSHVVSCSLLILVVRFHVGETPAGNVFPHCYTHFNDHVLAPFDKFLHVVYRTCHFTICLPLYLYLAVSLAQSVCDARRLQSPLEDESLIKFDDVKANNDQVRDDISA